MTKNTERKKKLLEKKEVDPIAEAVKKAPVITKDDIVKKGDQLYKDVKEYIKNHKEEYEAMDQKKRVGFFLDRYNCKEFMESFPVVFRYMTCHCQYSTKAFTKLLRKMETVTHPPPDKRATGYMEDQWIRRQADYVVYLWEGMNTHYTASQRHAIWHDTYKSLKGEFEDFRNMHKEVEGEVKKKKLIYNGQNVKDLIERLKSRTQKLNPEDEKKFAEYLKDATYKKYFNDAMAEITEKIKQVPESCSGDGRGSEYQKPVVTMIETVDEPEDIVIVEKEDAEDQVEKS